MAGTRLIRIAVLAVSLTAPASAQSPSPIPADLSDAEKLYGLSMLWREAAYNFAFFDQVPDLDWDAAYQAFIPQVLATGSTAAYYDVLARFVALLEDGHSRVWLPDPERTLRSYPWVLTRNVGEAVFVRNVGRSLQERIPIGSVILTIDDTPSADYVRDEWLPMTFASTDHDRHDRAVSRALHGPPGNPVTIRYETPSGEHRTLTLDRDRNTRDDEWAVAPGMGNRFEFRWLEDGIAYVAVNTFNDSGVVGDFRRALPELSSAKALVLDIRRNGGGNSSHGYRIAAHLSNDTLLTSSWQTREHVASYKAWGRWSEQYAAYHEMDAWRDGGSHGTVAPAQDSRLIVPTVVLQEHATYSAAEDFLVAIDGIPHITTIGRPSGGSTGQPLAVHLPGGGRANICTKRDTYPDGREFVGIGIPPDIVVETTVADMRAGRDPVLDRGLAVLRAQLAGSR
jgi:C-terminal processing protease CtpA/Prc